MVTRTTWTLVTFRRPFTLSSLDGLQPAGTYRLEIDDEQIEGLSFSAFRRIAMMLHFPADPVAGATRQVVQVDSQELAQALLADDIEWPLAPSV